MEMSAGNQSGVKAIFSRCLLQCPSANLWRSYLTFIKTVRSLLLNTASQSVACLR